MSAVLSEVERRAAERRAHEKHVEERYLLINAERRQSERRFTPAPSREVVIESRPELEHVGRRFIATFKGSPNGIFGQGNCESAAEDDLYAEVENYEELLREKQDGERERYGWASGEGVR
jgi:hypothetical protein